MKPPPLSLLLSAALGIAACQSGPAETKAAQEPAATPVTLLAPGPWRGELAVQGQQIPFLFEVKTEAGQLVVYLVNKGLDGEQRLRCPKITQAGDSVTVRMPTADAALVLRAGGAERLKGVWAKYDVKEPFRVPLVATAGERNLFMEDGTNVTKMYPSFLSDLSKGASYKVNFEEEDSKIYPAVGIVKLTNGSINELTGIFLTTTGNYKYLSGGIEMIKNKFRFFLSTFDGNHAFLFTGPFETSGISMNGDFYSSNSGHETFTATLDPNAKLPAGR